MVVFEIVLEVDIIFIFLQFYDLIFEFEFFQISFVNRNDKVSVVKISINIEIVEFVNVGNEDFDIILFFLISSQKFVLKIFKFIQFFFKKKSFKDDIIIKDQLNKENINFGLYSNVCFDDYEDEYCDNLVFFFLFFSSLGIDLLDKISLVSIKFIILFLL